MRIPFFAVHGTVGAGNSNPTDVVRLKKSLTKTGHGGSPSQPSPQFQSSTSRSLQQFQTDWNLKPDAVVNSGGPSEQTMDIALESLAWGDRDGMEEVRVAHNALTSAGLTFEPDAESPSEPGLWRDADGNAVTRAHLRTLLHKGEKAAGVTLDNVLRRDLVTGGILMPGDKEIEHDAATRIASPFAAVRKGPEFTKLVTRVFGGAPENAAAQPEKLGARGSSASMGRTGDDGSAKEAASAARATSFKSNDDDIEWEPDRRIYSGERKIKVKGPVKVKLQTNALSIDGLIYYVEWQPLDKNGNILPQFRGPNQPPKNRGRHVVPGNPDVQTFQPPYDHEHGFQVRIWIPPQQTPNGNTAGAYLDVFVPKGGKIK